jgi:copper(I)-binding protein
MRHSLRRLVLATSAVICGLAGPAWAEPMATIDTITVHDAWVRAPMGQTGTSAVYMTLKTIDDRADRLIAAASPAAAGAKLHTHIMDAGVARMRPVAAIEIAPGAPTVLAPGGVHIMLIGLAEKLVEGDTLPLSLSFEHAGTVELEVPVRGMGAGTGHGGQGGGAQQPTH